MSIMLATCSTNKIIVLKRYGSSMAVACSVVNVANIRSNTDVAADNWSVIYRSNWSSDSDDRFDV